MVARIVTAVRSVSDAEGRGLEKLQIEREGISGVLGESRMAKEV